MLAKDTRQWFLLAYSSCSLPAARSRSPGEKQRCWSFFFFKFKHYSGHSDRQPVRYFASSETAELPLCIGPTFPAAGSWMLHTQCIYCSRSAERTLKPQGENLSQPSSFQLSFLMPPRSNYNRHPEDLITSLLKALGWRVAYPPPGSCVSAVGPTSILPVLIRG